MLLCARKKETVEDIGVNLAPEHAHMALLTLKHFRRSHKGPNAGWLSLSLNEMSKPGQQDNNQKWERDCLELGKRRLGRGQEWEQSEGMAFLSLQLQVRAWGQVDSLQTFIFSITTNIVRHKLSPATQLTEKCHLPTKHLAQWILPLSYCLPCILFVMLVMAHLSCDFTFPRDHDPQLEDPSGA